MLKLRYILTVVLLTGLLGAGLLLSAQAAFNPEITYQGFLTDPAGDAVSDGNYNFRFKLCTNNACTAPGDPIWSETYCYSPDGGSTCNGAGTDQRAATQDGLFNIELGTLSTLNTVNFDQTLYLEVQVGGAGATPSWETLTPRKQLGAVVAAF